jgi:hypothetical protein
VALAGSVFGQKYVAGIKGHAGPIAETYIDAARQSDHPAPVRRAMVVHDMRREVVSQQQSFRFAPLVEKLRPGARVQRFQMGLAVRTRV